MDNYPEHFFDRLHTGSLSSAQKIVPYVLRLIQPKSVIDVGCGVGTWLSLFQRLGRCEILGVDGPYVNPDKLEIPQDCFLTADLEHPLRLDRCFDLAVSLEVAEHLPRHCAESFVDSLVGLAPVVLFSAAIPFQGGRNHVNEQWPDYWSTLFSNKGFTPVDCVRKHVWNDQEIDWWYAQNTLLYIKGDLLIKYQSLKREFTESPYAWVHPRAFLDAMTSYKRSLQNQWKWGSELLAREIADFLPKGEQFILIDDQQIDIDLLGNWRIRRITEQDGVYWGAPPDSITAIAELERLRENGVCFILFAWPAFWWFDVYTELTQYLQSTFRCLIQNDRLRLFDISAPQHHALPLPQ